MPMDTPPGPAPVTSPPGWPANHDRPAPPPRGALPEDAQALIYRPSRAATTAGRARSRGWRLVFARRSPPVLDPLMGWTGGSDTLAQVALHFPTLESALRHARSQGLACQLPGSALPAPP